MLGIQTEVTSVFDLELSEESTFGTAEELIKECLEDANIISISVEYVSRIRSYAKKYTVKVEHKLDLRTDFTIG